MKLALHEFSCALERCRPASQTPGGQTNYRGQNQRHEGRRNSAADEGVRNTISCGIAPDYASLVVYSLRKCGNRSWQIEAVQVSRAAVKSVCRTAVAPDSDRDSTVVDAVDFGAERPGKDNTNELTAGTAMTRTGCSPFTTALAARPGARMAFRGFVSEDRGSASLP